MSKTTTAGKKGSKIKIIIFVVILAVIIGFIAMMVSSASMMSSMVMAETETLERKNIENTISMSGIVESQSFNKVSSNLAYNIDTVNVEVGDKVKEGDILATLDSDELQNQILQQQAAVDSSNVNTEYSLSDAEKRYNEALEQISAGTYPEIRNAKMTLDNAEEALEEARETYEEQLEIQGSDKDSRLVSAEKSVESAKYELDMAYEDYKEIKEEVEGEDYSSIKDLKKAYDDAKKEYDSRHSEEKNNELSNARKAYEEALANYSYISSYYKFDPENTTTDDVKDAQTELAEAEAKLAELEKKYDVENTEKTYEDAMEAYNKAKADLDSANETKLKNAERTYERAKTSYDNAVNSLNSVKDGNETSIESYKDAVVSAEKNLATAKESYELAVKNAESSLASLKASADREKILSENDSQLVSLEILKDKLDDCVIKAPCDGTVTAVYAAEGTSAAGVLFIIEDTDSLKMTSSVKEYSISGLKEGIDVKVTIPSLGNMEFDGTISKIAPAGTKGADGKSDGTASFSVEVNIHNTKDSGVLIGMNSKCKAVTDSAENVFAVGYDALVEDADGSCYVYTADVVEGGAGAATARKISVETGFESDAAVEIISSELTEGMDIITNAGDMTDGGVIILASAFGEAMQEAGAGEAEVQE